LFILSAYFNNSVFPVLLTYFETVGAVFIFTNPESKVTNPDGKHITFGNFAIAFTLVRLSKILSDSK